MDFSFRKLKFEEVNEKEAQDVIQKQTADAIKGNLIPLKYKYYAVIFFCKNPY